MIIDPFEGLMSILRQYEMIRSILIRIERVELSNIFGKLSADQESIWYIYF